MRVNCLGLFGFGPVECKVAKVQGPTSKERSRDLQEVRARERFVCRQLVDKPKTRLCPITLFRAGCKNALGFRLFGQTGHSNFGCTKPDTLPEGAREVRPFAASIANQMHPCC